MKNLNDRVAVLQDKHNELDSLITTLHKNYADDNSVSSLKKEKLQIKEEIVKLQQEIDNA